MATSTKAVQPGRKSSGGRAYHHGDLRAALIRAALELIDAHGVKGFTLKDAARMAGVSIAAPYRHFADKNALLDAISAEGFAQFDAALAEAYERKDDPTERIVELGVAYVGFALEHTAHFRVMFGAMGGDGDNSSKAVPQGIPEGATGFLLLVQGVKELIPEASEEVQRDLILACWSLVHGFALLEIDGAFLTTVGRMDAEAQLRRTLSVIVAARQ